MNKSQAVIIGAGDGLSAAVARELGRDHELTLVARSGENMQAVSAETAARSILLDATDEPAVARLFDELPTSPRVVLYNASACVRRPITKFEHRNLPCFVDLLLARRPRNNLPHKISLAGPCYC